MFHCLHSSSMVLLVYLHRVWISANEDEHVQTAYACRLSAPMLLIDVSM